jgi:hypothetical protein
MAQDVGQRLSRGSGDDADHQLSGAHSPGQLAANADEHLGLDREHDHVRVLDRTGVVLDRTDPVTADQLRTTFGPRVAGDDLIRRYLFGAQQPGNHRFGHDAGTHGCDGAIAQRH